MVPASMNQLCGNALRGSGGGGIGIDRVFFAIYGKAGAVELPAIAGSCGFFHICEANLRHNAGQIVRSGVLGIAAGVPAAQGRVEVLRICSQLQGDVIGKIRRDSVHKAIVHSLEGGRLLLGRLGGSRGLLAGGEPQSTRLRNNAVSFFLNVFPPKVVLKIYKKQATRPETCHLQNQQIHGPVGPGAALTAFRVYTAKILLLLLLTVSQVDHFNAQI